MQRVEVKLKLNNVVFLCALENVYYNTNDRQPIAVTNIKGVIPVDPQGLNFQASIESLIICEECFEKNKKTGLMLNEPSKIITPVMKTPPIDRLKN